MANEVFKKIAKGLLLGAGTVLSILPGLGAVGAPLLVAGSAIQTGSQTSQDIVSVYGTNLNNSLATAAAMQGAGATMPISLYFQRVLLFIKSNIVIIVIGVGAIFFLPKLLKSTKTKTYRRRTR